MASVYKSFTANDVTTTRTLLYEAIPLTGALVSGTYGTFAQEDNIKDYSHGMFQTVYDYPYLSSSANSMFDITCGYSNNSQLSSSTAIQNSKKINIYNQMCQLLMGYDHTGSINLLDEDGDILAGGNKIKEAYFICFSRLLYKDEIKKGSFEIKLGNYNTFANANSTLYTINDAHATNDFRVNSPAGEYAVLTASSPIAGTSTGACGLIFYQAGIVVLTASIFGAIPYGKCATACTMTPSGFVGGGSITQCLTGTYISSSADMLRHRIHNISFNNTTELNSTIYFVRADHQSFNYSSNPTYLSGSKIRVKNNTYDEPLSYVASVGLYSPSGELLAVAKLSELLKKSPSTELTLKVRLDF